MASSVILGDRLLGEPTEDPVTKARMETRDYVWKHWAFHADQRLRAFHFFILVVTVVLAGSLTYVKDASHPAYVAPACLLLPILSWIFWRLDCRNRALIRHAESILKAIERGIPAELVPTDQQLFAQEEVKTALVCKQSSEKSVLNPIRWWQLPLSFYQSFMAMFFVFGAFGLVLGIVAIILPSQKLAPTSPPQQQNFYIGSQPVVPAVGSP